MATQFQNRVILRFFIGILNLKNNSALTQIQYSTSSTSVKGIKSFLFCAFHITQIKTDLP